MLELKLIHVNGVWTVQSQLQYGILALGFDHSRLNKL